MFSNRFSLFSGPSLLALFVLVLLLSLLGGCGGGGGSDPGPSNVGGGYTLVVSGGTLNDGSGTNGLSVLATLRDAAGNGPGGAVPWKISITGPGIVLPLVVTYDDGSPSSYSAWWWEQFDPLSGTYAATASNGTTTLRYEFTVDASRTLARPVLNKSGDLIYWNPVPGAGSYYYELSDGSGTFPVTSGHLESDPLVSQYSFTIPSLTDGSYLVSVYALSSDRPALASDTASWPVFSGLSNDSFAGIDFVQGGTGSGYILSARGGVLYEGAYSAGTGTPVDYYGLVIWTSIVTNSTPSTAPAGDWNVSVSGPGIATPVTYTHPRTDSHYIFWEFGIVPASGTYTVTASPAAGGTLVTQTFTIGSPTAKLPLATGLTVIPASNGGASASWNPVTGAASYYVNIWAEVGGIYTEIAGSWVHSTSLTVPSGTLTKGVVYDVYVTASQLDMTDMQSVPLPVSPGTQVDMSDTTFTYVTFTAI